mgnify:CR=1 FL=1
MVSSCIHRKLLLVQLDKIRCSADLLGPPYKTALFLQVCGFVRVLFGRFAKNSGPEKRVGTRLSPCQKAMHEGSWDGLNWPLAPVRGQY